MGCDEAPLIWKQRRRMWPVIVTVWVMVVVISSRPPWLICCTLCASSPSVAWFVTGHSNFSCFSGVFVALVVALISVIFCAQARHLREACGLVKEGGFFSPLCVKSRSALFTVQAWAKPVRLAKSSLWNSFTNSPKAQLPENLPKQVLFKLKNYQTTSAVSKTLPGFQNSKQNSKSTNKVKSTSAILYFWINSVHGKQKAFKT